MLKSRFISLLMSLIIVFNLDAGTAWAAPTKPANPKFSVASISLQKGEKVDLTSKLNSTSKVTYSFTSSNAKVASVTAAGVVSGISVGQATVTATVNQKGYIGKATVVIQVVASTSAGNTSTGAIKPVVYKDLTLLDADIRKGLQTLYKKDYTKLTSEEKAQRNKLLNIDRQQMLSGLQEIILKASPSWSTSMAQDFAAHNLEGDIRDIAAMFSKAGTGDAKQLAALELLKAFKSEKALKTFGSLLMSSTDANLRYSLAYLITKCETSEETITILINAVLKETDDKALVNEAAALIQVAGTDPANISLVLLVYGQLSDTDKASFASLFYYNDPLKADLFKAWKAVLTDSLQSSVDALKNAAESLMIDLKPFSPFKD